MNKLRLVVFLAGLALILAGLGIVVLPDSGKEPVSWYTTCVLIFMGSALIFAVRRK